jgi:hypothetical protein
MVAWEVGLPVEVGIEAASGAVTQGPPEGTVNHGLEKAEHNTPGINMFS